jgi:hypothetical protein
MSLQQKYAEITGATSAIHEERRVTIFPFKASARTSTKGDEPP